jgi:hypothetical protein
MLCTPWTGLVMCALTQVHTAVNLHVVQSTKSGSPTPAPTTLQDTITQWLFGGAFISGALFRGAGCPTIVVLNLVVHDATRHSCMPHERKAGRTNVYNFARAVSEIHHVCAHMHSFLLPSLLYMVPDLVYVRQPDRRDQG